MSVRNGYCDFCGGGNGQLLSTGDERSVAFYLDEQPVLWDGVCREGSKEYFKDFETPILVALIEKSEQVLKDDPIRWEPPYDDPKVHIRKIWISDEVFRGKQELVYRIEDMA